MSDIIDNRSEEGWILMFTLLLYSMLLSSPLDGFPVSHWLEPVAVIAQVRHVPAVNDPNLLLKVSRFEVVHRFDMTDFAEYSRQYLKVR